jgi:tripartite-type tricarboxylate transporter receptor subunit TctC
MIGTQRSGAQCRCRHLVEVDMRQAAMSLIADGNLMRRNFLTTIAVCLLGLVVLALPASGQGYPNKPIRIIAGAAPGGLIDLFARTFGQNLQARTGQPVLVENNSVATGTLGADSVAKSAPDGYTLLMGHPANVTIWPILNPKLAYDPRKNFAPIALAGKAANLLLVPKASPVNSVKELIALAKSKPGTLTYASQGLGSSAHMATEQFKLAAGIDVIHVPYRGSTPAVADLVSGTVSMMIDTVPFNLSRVKGGTLRALAVASNERASVLPDVPTMAEAGVPNVEGGLWLALFAPANTPPAVIAYLNKQAQEIFALPEVRGRMEPQGLVLPGGSPDNLAKFLAEEDARWRDVIKRAKIEFPH